VRTRRGAVALGVVACLAAVGLTGCAKPDYHYASEAPGTAPGGTVWFKVPYAWTELPSAQIAAAQKDWASSSTDVASLLQATAWQAAYDASPTPSLVHVLGRAAPDRPAVFASLRTLYTEEQSSASPSSLRDLLVPVTSAGTSVKVMTDQAVSQGRAHGWHLVVSYSAGTGQPEETVDETAYLSDGDDAVYLLVVRCTSTCYAENRAQIASVTSSYTIQEGRRG
jgi:hypothetical protein